MSAPTQVDFAAFIAGVEAYAVKERERGFVDGMLAGVEICAEAGHTHGARPSRRPRRPHPHLRVVTA